MAVRHLKQSMFHWTRIGERGDDKVTTQEKNDASVFGLCKFKAGL